MRKNKYGNRKVEYNGIKFDSKFEMKRYVELELLERAGLIEHLELQKEYILQDKFRRNGKGYRKISYYADFYYFDKERNEWIIEDTKGFANEIYKQKKKMLLKKYEATFFENNKKKQVYL
jgi:hypothetical protein